MIYVGERRERRGMKGWKDGRGVDSIISNFMAAFNGNTITFAAEGASGRREGGREGRRESEMAVNALFYRSIDGRRRRERETAPTDFTSS